MVIIFQPQLFKCDSGFRKTNRYKLKIYSQDQQEPYMTIKRPSNKAVFQDYP